MAASSSSSAARARTSRAKAGTRDRTLSSARPRTTRSAASAADAGSPASRAISPRPSSGERMGPGALEQGAGLVVAALAHAQLPEPDEAAAGHPGARDLEVADRGGQLGLGGDPVAAGGQHAPVGAAADAEQLARAPALGERPRDLAPLGGAGEVPDALAGRDQVAEGPALRDRQLELLARRDRRRLVEAAHPFVDVAADDGGDPLQREPHRLEVGDPELAAERRGAAGQAGRGVGVAAGAEGERALVQAQPAVVGVLREPVEQAARPLEPACGDRVLAAELVEVGRQPCRDAGRRARLAVGAERAVGALARLERERPVREPPGGPAESLPRLGGVAVALQRPLERGARVGPRARGERVAARRDRVLERLWGGGHRPSSAAAEGRRDPWHRPTLTRGGAAGQTRAEPGVREVPWRTAARAERPWRPGRRVLTLTSAQPRVSGCLIVGHPRPARLCSELDAWTHSQSA